MAIITVEVEMCKHGSPRLLCPVCSTADELIMGMKEAARKAGRKAAIYQHNKLLEAIRDD